MKRQGEGESGRQKEEEREQRNYKQINVLSHFFFVYGKIFKMY